MTLAGSLLEQATDLLRYTGSDRPGTLYGVLRLLRTCREQRDWAQGERIFLQARTYFQNSSRLWHQGARLAREQGLLSTADNRLLTALRCAERSPQLADLGHYAVLLHEAGSPGQGPFWRYWELAVRGRFADMAGELCSLLTTLGSEERLRLSACLRRAPPLGDEPWKDLFALLLRRRHDRYVTAALLEYPEVLALALRTRASLSRSLAEAAAWQEMFCRHCPALARPEHRLELAEKYQWLGRGSAIEQALGDLLYEPDERAIYLRGLARLLQDDPRGALELWHDELKLQREQPEVADLVTRLLENWGSSAELLEHLRRNPQLPYATAYLAILVHGLQPWREQVDGRQLGAELRDQLYRELSRPDRLGHARLGNETLATVRLQPVIMCPPHEHDGARLACSQLSELNAFFAREFGSACARLEWLEPVRVECSRALRLSTWRQWLQSRLPGVQQRAHYLVLDGGRPRLAPRCRIHAGWGACLQLTPFPATNLRQIAAALARSLWGLRPCPSANDGSLLEPAAAGVLARTFLTSRQRAACSTTPEAQRCLDAARSCQGERRREQLHAALVHDPWHQGARLLLRRSL